MKNDINIIAHRGAPILLQMENTMSSFRRAVHIGVDMLEIDVQVTKDGIPIAFHDINIDRVTEGNGLVNHFTLENMRQLRVGKEVIPTVEEVINEFKGKIRINFDIKSPEAVKPVMKLIQKANLMNDTLISSFKRSVFEELEPWKNKIRTGLLCWYVSDSALTFAKEYKMDNIHPYHGFLTREKVKLVHTFGFNVNAWTVDYVWALDRMLNFGVDGVITNRPLILAKERNIELQSVKQVDMA
jgi:glycerophosphoryl diester phosphodiesterase